MKHGKKSHKGKIITAVIIVAIVALFIWGYKKPGKYDNFASCLTEKGAVMYGTEWCSHCKNQKGFFGKSFQYVHYVDCDYNRQECLDAGVEGYPTWKIMDENYAGEQQLEKLAALSGCELNMD